MEGHLCRDDLRLRGALLVPVPASELDGTFVGFRTGVGEKYLIGEAHLDELLGQKCLGFIVVIVAAVDDLLCLRRNRFYECGITVSEDVNGDTADHIHVLLSVGSVEVDALAVVGHERNTFTENRHIVFFIVLYDLG